MFDNTSWKIDGTVLTVNNNGQMRCFSKSSALSNGETVKNALNSLMGEVKAGFAFTRLLSSVEIKKVNKANEAKEKEKAVALSMLTPEQLEKLKKVGALK